MYVRILVTGEHRRRAVAPFSATNWRTRPVPDCREEFRGPASFCEEKWRGATAGTTPRCRPFRESRGRAAAEGQRRAVVPPRRAGDSVVTGGTVSRQAAMETAIAGAEGGGVKSG